MSGRPALNGRGFVRAIVIDDQVMNFDVRRDLKVSIWSRNLRNSNSTSCGSLDSLKVSLRCGRSPEARQMRLTAMRLIPARFAISRVLQRVAPWACSQACESRLAPLAHRLQLALRARIVLRCAAELDNKAVARELRVTPQMVGKWRRRFVGLRLEGLLDEPRPGALCTICDTVPGRV